MCFVTITVIYNQLISESSVTNINTQFETEFIFVDNSTVEEICAANKQYCILNNFKYLNMQGNKGLPKAYNRAISEVKKDKNTWVIICDQDTQIPADFYSYYAEAISNNPDKMILCPVVKDSVGIMSPAKIKGKRFIHSALLDFNNSINSYSFINSCMCINSTIFELLKYDERLFLDYVDHDFVKMIRMENLKNPFYIITDLIIFQNFSGVTRNSLDSDYFRFQIYMKDTKYYYSKWNTNKLIVFLILLYRAMKFSIRHKSICFINSLVVYYFTKK